MVMEYEHTARLRRIDRDALARAEVTVLDVPDDYGFMDAELVEILTAKVDAVLGL